VSPFLTRGALAMYLFILCAIAVEWTSPLHQVVDSYPCYKHSPGVKDCLGYVRGAPLYKPLKEGQGRDLGEMFGTRQPTAEQLAEARRAYRFDICELSVIVFHILNTIFNELLSTLINDILPSRM